MKIPVSEKLYRLAKLMPCPLYVVGGYVRNFLIDKSLSLDVDLCAPISVDKFLPILNSVGFNVRCEYKRTGTVMFSDGESRYEFTSFRKETYNVGGTHTPVFTEFTDNIIEDAMRRDFRCNAVYYDVVREILVDPLNGIENIKNKILDTVCDADKVFSHDGLRLMRLARFSGELGFVPSKPTLEGAKLYAKNILDISAERIFEELKKILVSDTKYSFSDKLGHYHGLKILDKTGVLDFIIPELTAGRNMAQRSDFHLYDVLEHSLRCVMYADKSIRLSALLHDVGKPYCKQNFGRYHDHAKYGEQIARDILTRLKADKKTVNEVCKLTATHMFGVKSEGSTEERRLFIVDNFKDIEKILALMQADYSACKDDLSVSPTVSKLKDEMADMKREDVPFCLKDLKVCAKDLLNVGIERENVGKALKALQNKVVTGEIANEKKCLLKKSLSFNFLH